MVDVLIIVDDFDDEDYILKEKFVSPGEQTVLKLIEECWDTPLSYDLVRVKDLPRPHKACLILGPVAWKLLTPKMRKTLNSIYKTDHAPREIIAGHLNDRTVTERFLDLKNRLLLIYRDLTE